MSHQPSSSPAEETPGASGESGMRAALRRFRARIETRPRVRLAYRLAVGAVGGVITILGLLLVPLPGPGWLVVFAGIAVLGTEFATARRVQRLLRRVLSRVTGWITRRRRGRDAAPERDEEDAGE